ncbi:hypothetical protein ACP275_14G132700 [Erythranthe tilingii]
MDTTHLPFHIIIVILSMLPAKALAKFQCVCKAWKNIIRDPQFVKEHFKIKAAKGKAYLLYVPLDSTNERAFTLLCDETFDHAVEFKIPSEFRDMSFIIIGSCNGVLCFTDANSFGDVDFALGFGYYEQMNDYFIIRIAIVSDEEDDATCKIERWGRGYFGNLGYHMGEEVFRQKGLPNYKADGEDLVEHIGVYKWNLSMFVFHLSDHYSWNKNCHLWVMNEYGVVSSWTKLYTVVIDAGVVTPIMFTNNDEIIFEDGECDLTVCHFESNIISYLGVEDQGYLNFVTYNGSLVMLED